ncbi:MAG: hypothetical protein ACOYM0_01255 [Bacteroidales bacterium]
MIPDQIKIADDLIQYLKQNRGYSSQDDYPSYLQGRLHLEQDIWLVKKILFKQELINETGNNYLLSLTEEGFKAARMGYPDYCLYLEKKENDKESKDHRDAVMSKWQIIAFWPMFVFGVVGGISGIISLIWQLVKWLQ